MIVCSDSVHLVLAIQYVVIDELEVVVALKAIACASSGGDMANQVIAV